MNQLIISILILVVAFLGLGVIVGVVKVQDIGGKIFGIILIAVFGSIGFKIIEATFHSISLKMHSSGLSAVTLIVIALVFFIIIKWLGNQWSRRSKE